jgi:uncharacterized phiE125 gp8 family phage protein
VHPYDRIFRPAAAPSPLDPARLTLVTAPEAEPWATTDAELRSHLRLDDSTGDDAYLATLIKSARLQIERLTGLSLVNQTLKATWDRLPTRGGATRSEIELPRAPLVSISSITYLDSAGATQTLSASAYAAKDVGVAATFGRVALNPDYDWPDLGDYRGALSITFVAGFGPTAEDIPSDLRLAVLWLAAWWYESRLPVNVGNIVNPVPSHLDALLESHRLAFIG